MKGIIMKMSSNAMRMDKGVLLFGLFAMLSLTVGCSSAAKTVTYDVDSEIIGEEKEEILGTVNDRIYEEVERGDEKEELTELSAIYVGGKEASVPEGRYEIFGYQAGVITILNEDGDPWLKEVLNEDTVTVSLLDTDKIHADAGFDTVSITKAEENNGPAFTKGVWEVGVDIDPGTYKLSMPTGHGFVEIFEEEKEPRVYEIIGGSIYDFEDGESIETDTGIYKKVTLEEGQHIRITDIGAVKFEEFGD